MLQQMITGGGTAVDGSQEEMEQTALKIKSASEGIDDEEENHSKMKELDAFALEQMKGHLEDNVNSVGVLVLKRWGSLVHGHQVAAYFYSLSLAYKLKLDHDEKMEVDVERSLWIFHRDNRIRLCCSAVVSSPAFEWTIFSFILVSCALLALVRRTPMRSQGRIDRHCVHTGHSK